ncbi:MAG: CBS domain-containing protein [Acidimicrobiia bacterium]
MTVDMIIRAKGREVETIRPEATVTMAIQLFGAKGIGALVVTSDGEQVEGVLSERDVVQGLARFGGDVLGMAVSELMSRPAPICAPNDSVKHVMATMTRTRHRHLPVVDGGRLAGIVSIGDVVKSRLEELELETNVLRDAYLVHPLSARPA